MKQKIVKNLELTTLTAITPLDGRYREKITELAQYISEYSLIIIRFEIEAKYLVALSDAKVIRKLTPKERITLTEFGQSISLQEASQVKKIEDETRHDVKAMERAFRTLLEGTSLEDLTESIHLGLTSEDINNLAYRLMLKRVTEEVIIPELDSLVDGLTKRADEYKAIPMLGRTHGQAAIPTTVGKEIAIFASRLNTQLNKLKSQELTGKLNGAIGNFNALNLVYPDINWVNFSENFILSFEFKPNMVTNQINPYDDITEFFQNYQRINGIIINLDQDVWRYISDGWFVQEARKGEVGSSTMPQKVNPIDFENSEGNLTIANGIFETLSRKLAQSRLQRDLSDSTTIRNIGTALGFSQVGYKSILTGLSRIKPNKDQISADLNRDWAILGEGVQTLLRREKVNDPYSLISSLTRGEHIDKTKWGTWVDSLPIDEKQKKHLRQLTPASYIGLAISLTEKAIKDIKDSKKQK